MNEKIDVDSPINANAVSVYSESAMDDFPVLKAFQQYIDAEQAKSRKRLLTLGIFFGVLMLAVIGIFVAMLMNANSRNQTLNDRLVEFAMKERERQAAVVVQPPIHQDNSAINALTAKIEQMQKDVTEAQRKALETEKLHMNALETAKKEAAEKAAVAIKESSKEALEIERLKALLAAEKEKSSAEAEKRHQEEIEAYRRKYYPELYAPRHNIPATKPQKIRSLTISDYESDDVDELLEDLDDNKAINYFDNKKNDTDDEDDLSDETDDEVTHAQTEDESNEKKEYSVPVEVKKSNRKWRLPKE